jgi:copper chaperone
MRIMRKEVSMTVLNVPDMHCEMCVKRITNALTAAKLNFTVSLKDKTVSIDGDESAVKTAVSELDDLGFEAEKL